MFRLVRRACIGLAVLPAVMLISGCGQGESNSGSSTVTVTSSAAATVPSDYPCEYISDRAMSALMKVKMTSAVVAPEQSGTADPVCAYVNLDLATPQTVKVRVITSPKDYAENVCTPFPKATIEYRNGIVGCAFDKTAYLVPGDKSFCLEISYPKLQPEYQPGSNFGHLIGMQIVEDGVGSFAH